MPQRILQVTAALVFVAAIGAAAFFVTSQFVGGEASGQVTSQDSTVLDEITERVEGIIAADKALPRVRGEYGDFVVAGFDQSEPTIEVPCARTHDRAVDDLARIQQSELYESAFGDEPEVYDCADGRINFIGGSIQHDRGRTELASYYFTGVPIVNAEVVAGRLELTSVNGHPALIDRGLDTSPFVSQNRIFVIERQPSDGQPGIMTLAFSPQTVEESLKLLEELTR